MLWAGVLHACTSAKCKPPKHGACWLGVVAQVGLAAWTGWHPQAPPRLGCSCMRWASSILCGRKAWYHPICSLRMSTKATVAVGLGASALDHGNGYVCFATDTHSAAPTRDSLLVCHHADAGVGAAHEVWHEAHRVWWRDCVACAWFAAHHDCATHRRGEGGVHSHGTLSIRRCGKRRQGQSSGGGGAAREACGVRWHLLHLLGGAPTPPSRPRHATPCPSAGATRESRPAASLG